MVPGRYVSSTLFFGLLATCVVLAIVCACLISTIVLIRQYEKVMHAGKHQPGEFRADRGFKYLEMEPWERNHRVSPSTVPVHYRLLLHPHLDKGTFNGTADIDIVISVPTDHIAIHAKLLNITETRISHVNSNETVPIVIRDAFYSELNSFWVVRAPQGSVFPSGTVRLSLTFDGTLTKRIVGFYKSSYKTEGGDTRSLATTKFEPVDARSAFPCFDEPALKAKFTISVVRPTNAYSALSNMAIKSEEAGPGPGLTTVHFHTTVPMSTYLVCFIVSDFLSSGPVNISNAGTNMPIQVYSTPQQVENTKYARGIAAEVTKFYINYFGIPYSLPKLDLIAVPDFASGAMENWGLITFRETALLFDSAVNSITEKLRVVRVVAHEIAHQWFGNYVTMQWWDDLWLNEGFAKFMEFKATAKGVAECSSWKLDDYFLYSILQEVMNSDAALNSHPIVQPVNHPDEINQLFDSISYLKGASVLRMLEDFLGEDKFQSGLQTYLKANAYGSAATKDLWRNLGAVAPSTVDVPEIMATWTEQKGFPVVEVTRTGEAIHLTQKRFLTNSNATYDASESRYGYEWDIPIRYSIPGDQKHPLVWLKRNESELVVPISSTLPYVKINYKQIGYYRVNYQPDDWRILTANIQNFEPADRAHLINDIFELSAAGYTDYNLAFDMISYLGSETEFIPWAAARSSIMEIGSLLYSTPVYPTFREFIGNLVSPLYGNNRGQFNWTVDSNDSFLRRQLRVSILTLACRWGVSSCLEDVRSAFLGWLSDPLKPIHPDLRELVFLYGMKAAGTVEVWDKVWTLYKKETNAQKITTFQRALSSINEPWILQNERISCWPVRKNYSVDSVLVAQLVEHLSGKQKDVGSYPTWAHAVVPFYWLYIDLISIYLNYAWSEENVRSQDYVTVLQYIASNPVGTSIVWDFYRNNWPQLVERFSLRHRVLGSSILSITKTFATPLKLEELDAFYKKYPDAGAGSAARKNARENIENNIEWIARNSERISEWLTANVK